MAKVDELSGHCTVVSYKIGTGEQMSCVELQVYRSARSRGWRIRIRGSLCSRAESSTQSDLTQSNLKQLEAMLPSPAL